MHQKPKANKKTANDKKLQPELDKMELERKKLENRKIELENHNLELHLAKRPTVIETLNKFSGLAGLVTALGAIITIAISVYQWSAESEQNRIVTVEERLNKTLVGLGDPASKVRLSSVTSLKGFLDEKHNTYHDQVLYALVTTLGIESDSYVRNAIVKIIEGIETTSVSPQLLKQSLELLASNSRYQVETGQLYENAVTNQFAIPENANELIARDVSAAMISLIRKGVVIKDLSGIYCTKCDFSGLVLDNTNFKDAILNWSSFKNSKLRNSNFDGAELANTSFVKADLSYSRFTFSEIKGHDYHEPYTIKQINHKTSPSIIWSPDFSSANLSNADFTGHVLFGFLHDNARRSTIILNPQFANATLTNTNFSRIDIYGITIDRNDDPKNENLPFSTKNQDIRTLLRQQKKQGLDSSFAWIIFQCSLDDNATFTANTRFARSIGTLSECFMGSNWDRARMPKVLSDVLAKGQE
jgi:uncharacterized protein YjbI with pentapeptide repeats